MLRQITIPITLPETLVERAQAAGILGNEEIANLLEAELVRLARVERLFATMDKLAQVQPPLTQAEIDAEIDTARAESG